MNEDETSDTESRFTSGFFKKGTADKLTYKNIIADAINWCRLSMGTTEYKYAVIGLEKIIKFDIQGYQLSTEIGKIKDNLEVDKDEYIEREEERLGRKIKKRAEIAKLKIRLRQWEWEAYFEKLIQLLAAHDLLFDTERQIPFKKLGRLTGSGKAKKRTA